MVVEKNNTLEIIGSEDFQRIDLIILDDDILLDLHGVCIGLNFTQVKNSKKYIRWERVKKYLVEFGCINANDKLPEYISEQYFYKLMMKASNEYAKKFQNWISEDILPNIRKNKVYHMKNNEFDKYTMSIDKSSVGLSVGKTKSYEIDTLIRSMEILKEVVDEQEKHSNEIQSHSLRISNIENKITDMEKNNIGNVDIFKYDVQNVINAILVDWSNIVKKYNPAKLMTGLNSYEYNGRYGFYGVICRRFNLPKITSNYRYTLSTYVKNGYVSIDEISEFIYGIGTKYLISKGGVFYNSYDAKTDKWDVLFMEQYFKLDFGKNKTNCYICGKKLDKYDYEHIIPRSSFDNNNGFMMDILYNIAPVGKNESCSCNKDKNWENTLIDMFNKKLITLDNLVRVNEYNLLMEPFDEDIDMMKERYVNMIPKK